MSKKFAAVLVFLVLGYLLTGGCQITEQTSDVITDPIIVDVDDVVADPGAYEGIIGIRGIVSFVYPADSTFVIIDLREYELCGVVTCAINELAISVPFDRYSGELPDVKDKVVVYGEIISAQTNYSLKVLEVTRDKETILEEV